MACPRRRETVRVMTEFHTLSCTHSRRPHISATPMLALIHVDIAPRYVRHTVLRRVVFSSITGPVNASHPSSQGQDEVFPEPVRPT